MCCAVGAKFVDRQDVRMVEGRGGECFLLEAAQPVLVLRKGFGQDFQRNLRRSLVSSARYTSPIPPAPIFETMR